MHQTVDCVSSKTKACKSDNKFRFYGRRQIAALVLFTIQTKINLRKGFCDGRCHKLLQLCCKYKVN